MYLSATTHGERIRRCDAGRFILYESTYAPSVTLPRHYHNAAALMFATRGAFTENVARRTIECKAFDVLARPAGEAHSNRYTDRVTSCVIVNVPAESFDWLGSAGRIFSEPSVLSRPKTAPIAMRLGEELMFEDDSSRVVVEGLILELIGSASRTVHCVRPPTWLAHARDFIHEHAADRVTLRDIAAAANVHAASVVRAFRAHLRCSPGEYVRNVRIENAKRELSASDRALSEIALDAGFYDQSHFANAFRRATGMTPREWRNASRVQN